MPVFVSKELTAKNKAVDKIVYSFLAVLALALLSPFAFVFIHDYERDRLPMHHQQMLHEGVKEINADQAELMDVAREMCEATGLEGRDIDHCAQRQVRFAQNGDFAGQ